MQTEVMNSLELKAAPAPDLLEADQKTIWNFFEIAKLTCIRKNIDYGSSVFKKPFLAPNLSAGDAILVRMCDKVERLKRLISSGQQNVKSESIEDSMMDLGVYCFLYCISIRERSVKSGVSIKDVVPGDQSKHTAVDLFSSPVPATPPQATEKGGSASAEKPQAPGKSTQESATPEKSKAKSKPKATEMKQEEGPPAPVDPAIANVVRELAKDIKDLKKPELLLRWAEVKSKLSNQLLADILHDCAFETIAEVELAGVLALKRLLTVAADSFGEPSVKR